MKRVVRAVLFLVPWIWISSLFAKFPHSPGKFIHHSAAVVPLTAMQIKGMRTKPLSASSVTYLQLSDGQGQPLRGDAQIHTGYPLRVVLEIATQSALEEGSWVVVGLAGSQGEITKSNPWIRLCELGSLHAIFPSEPDDIGFFRTRVEREFLVPRNCSFPTASAQKVTLWVSQNPDLEEGVGADSADILSTHEYFFHSGHPQDLMFFFRKGVIPTFNSPILSSEGALDITGLGRTSFCIDGQGKVGCPVQLTLGVGMGKFAIPHLESTDFLEPKPARCTANNSVREPLADIHSEIQFQGPEGYEDPPEVRPDLMQERGLPFTSIPTLIRFTGSLRLRYGICSVADCPNGNGDFSPLFVKNPEDTSPVLLDRYPPVAMFAGAPLSVMKSVYLVQDTEACARVMDQFSDHGETEDFWIQHCVEEAQQKEGSYPPVCRTVKIRLKKPLDSEESIGKRNFFSNPRGGKNLEGTWEKILPYGAGIQSKLVANSAISSAYFADETHINASTNMRMLFDMPFLSTPLELLHIDFDLFSVVSSPGKEKRKKSFLSKFWSSGKEITEAETQMNMKVSLLPEGWNETSESKNYQSQLYQNHQIDEKLVVAIAAEKGGSSVLLAASELQTPNGNLNVDLGISGNVKVEMKGRILEIEKGYAADADQSLFRQSVPVHEVLKAGRVHYALKVTFDLKPFLIARSASHYGVESLALDHSDSLELPLEGMKLNGWYGLKRQIPSRDRATPTAWGYIPPDPPRKISLFGDPALYFFSRNTMDEEEAHRLEGQVKLKKRVNDLLYKKVSEEFPGTFAFDLGLIVLASVWTVDWRVLQEGGNPPRFEAVFSPEGSAASIKVVPNAVHAFVSPMLPSLCAPILSVETAKRWQPPWERELRLPLRFTPTQLGKMVTTMSQSDRISIFETIFQDVVEL